jgi:DNA-binding NarL/FixJ family response regulator
LIVGRTQAQQAAQAVFDVPSGGMRAMVIEGDAGIGKSTIWRFAAERAAALGWSVLAATSAQSETRLAYAGLADLLGTLADAVFDHLPAPQRRALAVALLREAVGLDPVDPRAVGMAVRATLERIAKASPVVVAIDDLHWFDAPSARALEFALRRFDAPPVVVLVAYRKNERLNGAVRSLLGSFPDHRLTRLRLGPLDDASTRQLVVERLTRVRAERGTADLAASTVTRLIKASAGNPLYAIELANEADDIVESINGVSVPSAICQLVKRRISSFPAKTREALVVASAQARPSISTVDVASLAPAEDVGVIVVAADGQVRFQHPLFAAAVYQMAGAARRRHIHAQLAQLAGPVEESARHLALATASPDPVVAAALDAAATSAARRGAPDDAVTLAEHALRLTPPDRHDDLWSRRVAVGRYRYFAGDVVGAGEIARTVAAEAPPPIRARALHLLGELAALGGMADAEELLLAATACKGAERTLVISAELLLAMLGSATGDYGRESVHAHLAHYALADGDDPTLIAKVHSRLALTQFRATGHFDRDQVERTIAMVQPEPGESIWTWTLMSLAYLHMATAAFDVARMLLERMTHSLEAVGDTTERPWVESYLTLLAALMGDMDAAERHCSIALSLSEQSNQMTRSGARRAEAFVSTIRGDLDGATAAGEDALAIARATGWSTGIDESTAILAQVALQRGDPDRVLSLLAGQLANVEAITTYDFPRTWSTPDAFDALIQVGQLDRVARLSDALATWGAANDCAWPHALGLRGRAMVLAARGDLDGAAVAIDAALAAHLSIPAPMEHARSLMVSGQIARRSGRRRDAKALFGQAREVAEAAGAVLWVQHADAELGRLGTRHAQSSLSATEHRAAELAAEGLTNNQIAAQLFISRRTVETNLDRAYRKLGIHSRAQLAVALGAMSGPSQIVS